MEGRDIKDASLQCHNWAHARTRVLPLSVPFLQSPQAKFQDVTFSSKRVED